MNGWRAVEDRLDDGELREALTAKAWLKKARDRRFDGS